ncbi:hypothetical protein [Streptomyces spinosisporus]|uniref:Uncharacterized protein n=1 Tax=Streptomyces spinosisporus TaxID=2927582 RepID=A0ABS9XUI4_9ACTN|nr:hypothetical protein [Streptomyces spinosisporus]MCI3245730.1 hypothetical protein [Streptomyces spinosisporus]
MLLGQAGLGLPDLDSVAIQLTGALEGPLLFYLALPEPDTPPSPAAGRPLADSWSILIHRLLHTAPGSTAT